MPALGMHTLAVLDEQTCQEHVRKIKPLQSFHSLLSLTISYKNRRERQFPFALPSNETVSSDRTSLLQWSLSLSPFARTRSRPVALRHRRQNLRFPSLPDFILFVGENLADFFSRFSCSFCISSTCAFIRSSGVMSSVSPPIPGNPPPCGGIPPPMGGRPSPLGGLPPMGGCPFIPPG